MAGSNRDGLKDCGEIYGLYVHPAYQRLGVGKRPAVQAAQYLGEYKYPRLILWTLSTNPAWAFYEKIGRILLAEKEADTRGQTLPLTVYQWSTSYLKQFNPSPANGTPIAI